MTNTHKQHRSHSPTFITIVALVAALYFGREFLMPLALAILFVFLLTPVVQRLEKIGLGRVGSVLVTTFVSFLIFTLLAWMLAVQVFDLATKLPSYQSNLHAKIVSLYPSKNGPIARAVETFDALAKEVTQPDPKKAKADTPMKVEVVTSPANAMALIWQYVTPIFSPLGNVIVVTVFVVFMLLQREDLRDRIIHLVAHGKLKLTTQALDETGERVSRYLLAQLVVNVLYGVPVGLGLWWIGVPNAFLWGLLAVLLRFLPYIGPWIAAAFPILLSLAISVSWKEPLMTISLFVIMEVISNNVVEPWLYGSSTGLSSLAVIVSAVFWTWLWGIPGLLLATPLTVCIAVVGKYIPSWNFLDVMLCDHPPIASHERLYQRLLALDEIECEQIVQTFQKENPDSNIWDELFFPVIQKIDSDADSDLIEDEIQDDIYSLFRELIANYETLPAKQSQSSGILLLPARNETDELSAVMLQRALALKGVESDVMSSASLSNEMLAEVFKKKAAAICICSVPPGSALQTTWLVKRIHADLPEAWIIAAAWSKQRDERRAEKLKNAGANYYHHTFEEATKNLIALSRCSNGDQRTVDLRSVIEQRP